MHGPALAPSEVNVTLLNTTTVCVSFPQQDSFGEYSVQAGTAIADIFGLMPPQSYTGNFSIWSAISGTVTDANDAPVANGVLQPNGGLAAVTTGTNGEYSLAIPTGWNGTVAPLLGAMMFVPASLAYTNAANSLTSQDCLMVPTIAPNLTSSMGGTNLSLTWPGFSGVNYRIQYSANLVDWLPDGDVIPGTNGPMQFILPLERDPEEYFRLSATQ